MKITNGAFYENKSHTYLFRSLKINNPLAYSYLRNKLSVVAVGIADYSYKIELNNNEFFILVKSNMKESYKLKNLDACLESIRKQTTYITDYSFGDFGHMIVLTLPYEYMKINFIKGKYSSIYSSHEIIDSIFQKKVKIKKNEVYNDVSLVLKGHWRASNYFSQQLKNHFDYSDALPGDEYDLPPILGEEIFNFDLLK